MKKLFKPFEVLNKTTNNIILICWLLLLFSLWGYSSMGDTHLFPSIPQVLRGFVQLWNGGLIVHLFSSLSLCFQAIFYSVLISLIFAYASTISTFKPWSIFLSKLRFLPLTGLTFYVTIMVTNARNIQISVLVIFMTMFLITSLIQMISDIPEEEFDHARTLGCNRWEILLEVVIKGRLDYVIELVRQNLAIVWVFLVTTESILIASGGLGVLIKNNDKTGDNGKVIAVQIVIILVGILLDWILIKLRKLIFKYSNF
jgi:ABC-type nitrate/sulfonate/bicarbonate transport system permease component